MSKRSLSDSDCDDFFSDQKESFLNSTNSCSHQGTNRKKRRGIIEKRRRDRINNSLSELRRLVPTAFEKQGSAKLEKAEILQMTVDHLKMMHSKGLDSLAYDQKFTMDYQSIGFRECIKETDRYLIRSEGLDSQDPLYQRIISHLNRSLNQRELANRQSSSSSWALPAHSYILPAHPSSDAGSIGGFVSSQTIGDDSTQTQASSYSNPSNSTDLYQDHSTSTARNAHSPHHHPQFQFNNNNYNSLAGLNSIHPIPSTPSQIIETRQPTSGYWMSAPPHPISNPYPFPTSHHPQPHHPSSVLNSQASKPHRPWSWGELAC